MFVFHNVNDIPDLCFDSINTSILVPPIDCMFSKVNPILKSRSRILAHVLDCVYA